MDEIIKDERFKHIVNDSKFKTLSKTERKFKVDKRFKNMFHDKKFKLKYSVDKRGRPINLTTNDNLKKFYELSSSEDEESDNNEETKSKKLDNKTIEDDVASDQKSSSSADEEEEEDDDKSKAKVKSKSDDESGEEDDEELDDESESSDEEEDESDESDSVEDKEIPWNEYEKELIREEKVSHRLAVCNMDWDRIKAVDLFVLLNSFKSSDGVIKSVKIYVSEYGKERINYEKLHGPHELTSSSNKADKSESDDGESSSSEDENNNYEDDEEGNKFDRFKLRKYQFNRLKYYYAIVECDSSETASKIYSECDGNEYESSCTRLDLRFVDDETTFDEQDLKESCTEAPDPLTYKPNLFITTALNQTKVECTWDETPRERLAVTMKKYTEDELKNLNLKHIIATSSEEEEEEEEEPKKGDEVKKKTEEVDAENETNGKEDEEEKRIKAYRELLLGSDSGKKNKKRDGDLEFSWEGGMEEEGFNELLFNSKKKTNKSKKKFNEKAEITEEEKKEQAQLSLLTIDDNDGKAHFNLDDLLLDNSKMSNKKKKKALRRKEEDGDGVAKAVDNFQLNVSDPRFEAIFVDHKFNIDPSDQNFKKTKAMENLLDEKIKRKFSSNNNNGHNENKKDDSDEKLKTKNESSLAASLLVKSIKSKTEVLKRKQAEISNKKNKMLKN